MFWIAAALITIAVLALLLSPFARKAGQAARQDESVEAALYRSQLASLEAEVTAGRIAADEIEATKTELKRRMLTAAQARAGRTAAHTNEPKVRTGKLTFLAAGIGVPLLALGVYLAGGHPSLPDRPFAAREEERKAAGLPSDQEIALVRRLANEMAQHPEDPEGWRLLGGAYLRQGRFEEAVAAFIAADQRKPSDPDLLTALGEAMVLRDGGEISEEARAKLEAAHAIDPKHVRASFMLALAKAQAGDLEGAIADWSSMLDGAPQDAPWRSAVETEITAAKSALLARSSNGLLSELDPKAAAAAEAMSPDQRAAMITSMIEGLAGRLAQVPDDLPGWLRLARSYAVLNDAEKAKAALDRAAAQFAGDSNALAQIEAMRKDLGLK